MISMVQAVCVEPPYRPSHDRVHALLVCTKPVRLPCVHSVPVAGVL